MPRNGRDEPKKVDTTPPRPVVASKDLARRMVTYSQSEIPVRTVILMEVGELPAEQVRQAVTQVRTLHGEPAHTVFVLPVRNGKLSGDVVFESEILEIVGKICEVKDGRIVLRGGANDVDIMRSHL